jgi:hypothetical protein
MRWASAALLLGVISVCRAADFPDLPANTWVELKFTTEQPADPDEKGQWGPAGWNKLVYDPDGKRVLFYDRWVDKKHGGTTIYGNCLFAFDPAAGVLSPVKIDNWMKVDVKDGGYRTTALPANDDEPTPCSRHVYHAFDYVPELKSVFICNGANQSALLKDKLVGHDLCDGAWRLDLTTKKWTKIEAADAPPNTLDDGMACCPDVKSLVYSGSRGQIWILDPAAGKWRKAKESPPTHTAMGRTLFYDPVNRRMLIVGGGPLDGWQKGKATEFHEMYAFDPKTELVSRLADCPTAFYATHLAYDSKRQLFVAVAIFNKDEQPSGMFAYDPKADAWKEIKPKNPIPPHNSWFGWTKLCYDPDHDCCIGMIRDKFYAFRYVPGD